MEEKKIDKTCLCIDGSVERSDNLEIDIDKFNDEFIEWIESKGLLFCGFMKYMKNEE